MNARIFAVEDDAPSVAALKRYIEKMGYEFVGNADSGEAAMEQIRQVRPDLVLMDIELNGAMDGIELAARMRCESTAAVVYLTGHTDAGLLARAKLTEPHGYLTKPFNMQGLQAAIEMALYKCEAERKQQRIFDAVVQTITELTKLHDPYLKDVQTRAAALAEAIASELKLPRQEIQGIRLAAMLHGVGLVGIPSSLIFRGPPLQGNEKTIFQNHPKIASQLLIGIEFPYPVAETVYQQMERLDGSGFPRGLSGAAISPGARIVAVACEVARILTPQGPETPPGVEATIHALEQGRDTLFDAKAVDACARLFRERGYAIPG